MPMMRIMDSYIICYIQDMGNVFTYIDYDKLPEGLSVEEMNNKAFENLSRDIRYRYEESKISGIFGVLCGGDFEAEVLLFDGAWKNIADEFGDDLMIVVPTKDMVMFTKASDKKLCKELLNRGRELFDSNQKETPYLLFSKDIFIFSREESRMILQKKSL